MMLGKLVVFIVGILFTISIQMIFAKFQMMKNEKQWIKEVEMMKKEATSLQSTNERVYDFE